MLNIVIPNYFPALVSKKKNIINKVNNTHNQPVLIATNDGCCENKIYFNEYRQLHSITIFKVFVDFYFLYKCSQCFLKIIIHLNRYSDIWI